MDSTKASDEGSPPYPGPGNADTPKPAPTRILTSRVEASFRVLGRRMAN
ncbi:hypothetical protein ACIQ8G_16860 [Streptomyces sp. NPDC094154]